MFELISRMAMRIANNQGVRKFIENFNLVVDEDAGKLSTWLAKQPGATPEAAEAFVAIAKKKPFDFAKLLGGSPEGFVASAEALLAPEAPSIDFEEQEPALDLSEPAPAAEEEPPLFTETAPEPAAEEAAAATAEAIGAMEANIDHVRATAADNAIRKVETRFRVAIPYGAIDPNVTDGENNARHNAVLKVDAGESAEDVVHDLIARGIAKPVNVPAEPAIAEPAAETVEEELPADLQHVEVLITKAKDEPGVAQALLGIPSDVTDPAAIEAATETLKATVKDEIRAEEPAPTAAEPLDAAALLAQAVATGETLTVGDVEDEPEDEVVPVHEVFSWEGFELKTISTPKAENKAWEAVQDLEPRLGIDLNKEFDLIREVQKQAVARAVEGGWTLTAYGLLKELRNQIEYQKAKTVAQTMINGLVAERKLRKPYLPKPTFAKLIASIKNGLPQQVIIRDLLAGRLGPLPDVAEDEATPGETAEYLRAHNGSPEVPLRQRPGCIRGR